MKSFFRATLATLALLATASAFVSPMSRHPIHPSATKMSLQRETSAFTQESTLTLLDYALDGENKNRKTMAVHVAAFASALMPLAAFAAEQADEYEYGAVSAPPIVPIVGGLLAILTALLPIVLRRGEEAFEEMKARDDFGKKDDALDKSRKRK